MSVEMNYELELPKLTASFRFSGHSDRGAVRRVNEDSFLAAMPLFIVADGMGGHAHGDRASQTAIATFVADIPAGDPSEPQAIVETVRRANAAVVALSGADDALSGTTLTGLAFVQIGMSGSYHWMVFNVGDSRIYEWDGRRLEQVSVDHSAVQEMVDAGEITRIEAEHHPHRNVVTRALGASREVDPDIWLLPARARQRFLLCSDGLTKELDDDEIARIMVFHDSQSQTESDTLPMTLAERLVNAAVAAGGSDNVTVIVIESVLEGVSSLTGGDSDDTVERESLNSLLEDTTPRG